ncbi:MAG: glycosyltransferase [Bacteroidales bacterium]|nr:glycosyltransferase [Bacteroidales bacterium]
MRLAVVIVNYNVKYFLRQCLSSVFGSNRTLKDGSTLELEVWVVDNDSVDGSIEMVRSEFPEVHVIENKQNVGFARANNQALVQVGGMRSEVGGMRSKVGNDSLIPHTSDLILLLNPDTVVENDTFVKCVDFMHDHPDAGGLTVKMVDGDGNFLKESKRGFPTPEASFYKISGLIKLFPHSRRIAAYYMGHLPENEVNEIEIMPGAFLMISREAYDKIGGLDESYFMYGEDIDYSWRIHLAGFKNYYFPLTHIIHYKGESTKRGSMNYVYTFYNAMSIFVKRYFSGSNARLFNALLRMAIWLRASLAWAKRIGGRLAMPLLDFGVAYGGFLLIKRLWAELWANNIDYYPPEYTYLVMPLYVLILMCGSWLAGGYDKPVRHWKIVKGMGIGLLLLLSFYSLLDEGQRYSRMLLLAGGAWTLLSTLLIRTALGAMGLKGYARYARRRGKVLVVGSEAETTRVKQLYALMGSTDTAIIAEQPREAHHLQDLIRIEKVDEVVFCGADIELKDIISLMATLRTTGVEYKIAPENSDYVIGSNSILSRESLFLDDLETISTDACRRNKRLFDLTTALMLLLLSPVLFWFQRRKNAYYADCLRVLAGRRSWVGFRGRKGIFSPADLAPGASPELQERLLLRYMRHYKTSTDASILLHNLNNI